MARAILRALGLGALMVLSLNACRSPGSTGPTAAPSPLGGGTATPRSADDPGPTDESLSGPTRALELAALLPSDTELMVAFTNPLAAADALGRLEMGEAFAAGRATLAAQLRQRIGVDLTSPDGFAAVGLAVDRPCAYATLGRPRGMVVVVFSVNDPRLLRARLLDWEGANLTVERLDGAEFYRGRPVHQSPLAVIVERGVAVFVATNGPEQVDDAERVARNNASERLDRSPAFRAALAGLPPAADAVLFAASRAVTGQDPVAAGLFAGLVGVGAAARIAADRIEAEITFPVQADSPLAAAIAALRAPSPDVPVLEHFGETPPVQALEFSFDPEAMVAAAVPVLTALEPPAAAGTVERIARELLPLLSGDLGYLSRPGLVAPPSPAGGDFYWPVHFDQTVLLGVNDPARARRFLERLATPAGGRHLRHSGQDFTVIGASEGYRLGVRGQTLVVTQDVAELAAVRAGWPDSATWDWSRVDQRAPLEYWRSLDWFLRRVDDDEPVWPNDYFVPPELPGDPATVRATRRELLRLLLERKRLQYERTREAVQLRLEVAGLTGTVSLALAPSPDGLRGHATLRPGLASFGETWSALASALAVVRAFRASDGPRLVAERGGPGSPRGRTALRPGRPGPIGS